jgi:asparagine synthase (glutamine-hydrolysing)
VGPRARGRLSAVCGIAGFVGNAPLDDAVIGATLRLMRHRGPDAQAARRFETPDGRHVHLLHARLNIIDLDPRSNQPFAVGSRSMAYNGELYNYLELRSALAREGIEFRTTSDTEVLLQALSRWGWAAMERCEGMWAFAVYDERTGELGLCRDRFGEKPLYLYHDDSGLYFGSEVKFISALAQRRLGVNHRHLHRYLVNGYKALYKTPDTFFEGVTELRAGATLQVGDDGERLVPYWRPPVPAEDSLDYDEAVAGVRDRVIRSVELRLRADVPLAFCMSGGVDSQSLISVARRVFDYDVHGFTIVNEDERYEEQDMVDHAVHELGVRHTSIPVDTSDFIPRLRGLVRHHDAPLYTITYFAHWLLMESIAEHGYRISVSGTAADELFSGYYDHHLAYLRDVHGEDGVFERSVENWRRHVAPLVRNPFLKDPQYFVADPARREHIYLGAEEFASHLRVPFDEGFEEVGYTDRLLRNRMLNELFAESVPVILHEDDHNAMFFSIENRSPFLDRELFEYSLRVPTRHLVQDGRAKAVLRDAMRGIAPDRILESRRKVGFNAPIHSFLDTNDAEVRDYLLGDGRIFEHVRREAIEGILDLDWLPNSQSKFLFNFLNCKLFLEEFET